MAFKMNDDQDDDIVSDINITPVADLFLVLLIIFMVTSSAFTQNGVKVDLPKASNANESSVPEATVLTLKKDGSILINSKVFTLENLEENLKDILNKAKQKLVVFEGDTQTQLGTAVKIMDIAKKAGASELAIATESENMSVKR